MRELFDYADAYLEQCSWKDMALLKFCLAAMGLLGGLWVPREKKKPVAIAALLVFVTTYVPLMTKFFRVVAAGSRKEAAE